MTTEKNKKKKTINAVPFHPTLAADSLTQAQACTKLGFIMCTSENTAESRERLQIFF